MSTVLLFGTFDGLHPGHEAYFSQAKEHGENVVVVVARDETVMNVKGQLPATNQSDRLKAVAEHPLVTEARLGHPGDKYRIIEEIRPDVILLGYDQQAFTDRLQEELDKRGMQVPVFRAKAFHPEIYKSSKLRETESAYDQEGDEDELPL